MSAEASAAFERDAAEAASGCMVATAIFASRETPEVLFATIAATIAAMAATGHEPRPANDPVIDVLVNGNPALAAATARHAATATRQHQEEKIPVPLLRVWSLVAADKSNAWNQYVHRVWPGSEFAFFIDGYVRLRPDAIRLLAQGVAAAAPAALGGSGVPSVGRSAAAARRIMQSAGGIHGNCFCLTRAALQQIRQLEFRLPLGLYRGDAMIGAVLAYRLDPARHQWDLKNAVLTVPTASWDIDAKRWWRLADLRAALKRRDRQAQGELENLAMRDHLTLRRKPPQTMPATVAQLVLGWAANSPDAAALACRRSRHVARALEALKSATRDWSAAEVEPLLLLPTG